MTKEISFKIFKITSIVYLLSFFILIIPRQIMFVSNEIFDRDRYIWLFKDFIKNGSYNSIIKGTSVLFNLWNLLLYKFVTQDINLLFKLTNYISVFIICFIGCKILNRSIKQKFVLLLLATMYCLLWLDNIQLTWSNDDLFLTIFVMIIYLYIVDNPIKISDYQYVLLGSIYGLMFSIRELSILLLPILFLFMFQLKTTIKQIILFIGGLLITILVFHFPSLLENKKLSFYDKNSEFYKIVNTLGMLEFYENGAINFSMKDLYNQVWDTEKIENLTNKYQIKTFPNNIFSVIYNYPLPYLKMFIVNILYVIKYLFRRYAFLLMLPLYMLINDIRTKHKNSQHFYVVYFILGVFTLLFVLNTFIEFRWLNIFEFLLFFSIAKAIDHLYKKENYNLYMFSCINLSFVLLTVFNISSILK